MIVVVDFDGTVVEADASPPRLLSGAREGLLALRRAGHVLLLCSARANRASLEDPRLDPLVRAGVRRAPTPSAWERERAWSLARYREMCAFVSRELPGVFHAIDDGMQGKPIADLYLDDRALRMGPGPGAVGWARVAEAFGEPAAAPLARRVAGARR